MFTNHTSCRACGYASPGPGGTKSPNNEKLIEVLDLGVQPLANAFLEPEDEQPGFAPLKVLYCPKCSLAQLSVVVDPIFLYSNYSYVTSTSETMRSHFHALWNDMRGECDVKGVAEIGSNTGTFLRYCLDNGASRVVGIDPAENLCDQALKENGVVTVPGMMDEQTARMANSRVHIDCVVARHVFCHAHDWKSFLINMRSLGHDDTIYCIEVPYAPDTIRMNSWDQIYHEHLSYLTLKAMSAALTGTGMHIHRVRKYPVHGGAIVITLRRVESSVLPDPETCAEVDREKVTQFDWENLATRALYHHVKLANMVEELVKSGKRVAALGASAKSTVWINSCKFKRKHIEFIADNTPQKQYTLSPGSNIPIVDEGSIIRELPDYVVCFAWNYRNEILEKHALARSKGVKFIFPVPEIEIV